MPPHFMEGPPGQHPGHPGHPGMQLPRLPMMMHHPPTDPSKAWTEHTSEDGRVYYYNQVTKQSSWDKPEDLKSELEKKLSGCQWKEYKDQSGKIYYHNVTTKESSWTIPPELQDLKDKVMQEEAARQEGVNGKSKTETLSSNNSNSRPVNLSPTDTGTNLSYPGGEETCSILTPTTRDTTTNSPSLLDSVPIPTGSVSNSSSSSSSSTPTPSLAQGRDIKEVFTQLLREKNVSSTASWEFALKLVSNDSRYDMFRHHPERKQMFNNYKIQRQKEEKEEQRARIKKGRQKLEEMLSTSTLIDSNTRYRQASDLFKNNEVWKNVPEDMRRDIFRDVVEELGNKERDRIKQTRKRNMQVLADILDAMPSITFQTTWSEAQQLLLDNPVFAEDTGLLGMDKEDALIVFEDHIRSLEKEEDEERRREKNIEYRQQRKNREAFITLLDHLHKQGKLTSLSKWSVLYPDMSTDARFTAMLSQPLTGSTALDLFKFYVEDLRSRYEQDKKLIRDIIHDLEFQISLETKYDEFAQVLGKDDRSKGLDVGNVKMVFDRLVARVAEKEKEKQREENRKRKRIENNFFELLHSLEPSVDENSNWDQVRKAISEAEAFTIIPDEEERINLFKKYILTAQESCSHHHSKPRKKAKKDRVREVSPDMDSRSRSRDDSGRHHDRHSPSCDRKRIREEDRALEARDDRSPPPKVSRPKSPAEEGEERETDEDHGVNSSHEERSGQPEEEESDIEELERQRKLLLQQLAKAVSNE